MTYTPRRTPEQWQQLIEQAAISGLTQKRFCEQHGIRPATFGHWKRKLSAVSSSNQRTDSSWLDLSSVLGGEEDSVSWKIELDLGNGVVLRLNQQ